MSKKRTKADKLLRSADRADKRVEARPDETTRNPKQDSTQPAPDLKKAS